MRSSDRRARVSTRSSPSATGRVLVTTRKGLGKGQLWPGAAFEVAVGRGGVDQADMAGGGGVEDQAHLVLGHATARIGHAVIQAELGGAQSKFGFADHHRASALRRMRRSNSPEAMRSTSGGSTAS